MIKQIYYFGSFNPFHIGHRMVATVVSDYFYGCKVYIAPSPCSPFKNKADMIPIEKRIEIIEACIEGVPNMEFSGIDIAVGGDKPNHYTYETLEVIKMQYEGDSKEIGILIGSDELAVFDKWKNWEWIMDNFTVIVYPRVGDPINMLLEKFPKVVLGTAYYENEFVPQKIGAAEPNNLTREQLEHMKDTTRFEDATKYTVVSKQPYLYFEYSATEMREKLKHFKENYKELRCMYNDKALKILAEIYDK